MPFSCGGSPVKKSGEVRYNPNKYLTGKQKEAVDKEGEKGENEGEQKGNVL